MEIPDNCKEFFLRGISDVFVYSSEGASISIPFNVPQIKSLTDCSFQSPLLHISSTPGSEIWSESFTAKTTISLSGNQTIYTFQVDISLTDGLNNVREAYKNIQHKHCHVVLRKLDGSLFLCYALPGTFYFTTPTSTTQSEATRSVSITLKSLSDYIPVTIKD